MKKLILICLLAATAMGCKGLYYQKAAFSIGMQESDFKQANKFADLVSSNEQGLNIYRTINLVATMEPYSFFYFNNKKLTSFVKSDRLDDYKFIQY